MSLEMKLEACEQENEQLAEDLIINRSKVKKLLEQVNQTQQVVDACEAANLKHLQRIEQLEELCQELAGWIAYTTMGGKITKEEYAEIENKLHDAGLGIEPSENEVLLDQHFKDSEGKTPIEQLEALTAACRKQVD